MLELLQWLDLHSVKNLVVAKSATSLVFLYFFAYLVNRKAAFIVAFLSCEFYGNSVFSDMLHDVNFYLGYALIYCLLYFHLFRHKEKLTTLSAVMMAVFLGAGSAIDAYYYPEDETLFYEAYPYIYLFVHLCIIISLINWRLLRTTMGEIADRCASMLRNSYGTTFLW